MPNNAINPIPAEILKLVLVICKAINPPTIAKGTFKKTNPASFKFPNIVNSNKKINKRLIGTT